MLLTACRNHESDSPHTWNLNNGVTLWNLRHERMEEVYTEWYRRLVIRMGKKKDFGSITTDRVPRTKTFLVPTATARRLPINAPLLESMRQVLSHPQLTA